ncbi:NPCBM/NEW2 domain-containing protein [Nonomuraea sp. NPDC059023]|uniref:NPCBM/NEW2 domain-containing protein n=1 Tax=unclassified Nonomuraea TaxID=2593643 RepID=UPI0036838DFC
MPVERTPEAGRDSSAFKAAVVTAIATVLAAAIAAVGAFATGWLQFRNATDSTASSSPAADHSEKPDSSGDPSATHKSTSQARVSVAYLRDFQIIEGRIEASEHKANTKAYEHGIFLGYDDCSTDFQVGYNLDRKYRRLRATIAPADTTRSGIAVRFMVFLDGRKIADHDLAVGQERHLDLKVEDGLRVVLMSRIHRVGEESSTCPQDGDRAVWGDPQVS